MAMLGNRQSSDLKEDWMDIMEKQRQLEAITCQFRGLESIDIELNADVLDTR